MEPDIDDIVEVYERTIVNLQKEADEAYQKGFKDGTKEAAKLIAKTVWERWEIKEEGI